MATRTQPMVAPMHSAPVRRPVPRGSSWTTCPRPWSTASSQLSTPGERRALFSHLASLSSVPTPETRKRESPKTVAVQMVGTRHSLGVSLRTSLTEASMRSSFHADPSNHWGRPQSKPSCTVATTPVKPSRCSALFVVNMLLILPRETCLYCECAQ